MAQGKIEIQFIPTGDKAVVKAINQLNIATKKLESSTHKYKTQVDKTSKAQKKLEKRVQRVNKKNKEANSGLLALGGTLSVARSRLLIYSFAIGLVIKPIARLLSHITRTASEFESLETRLKVMTGSTLKAAKAFDTFNKVAAKTPFTLKDITNAGVALKAFGANAEETIRPVADLAAFMGVNATEAAQAFGRAFAGGAGAADILRERGVLELVKSFSGVKDLTKLTLPKFRKALIETIQAPTLGIAGSTEELSKTFSGSYSNMQDALIRLSAAFGNVLSPTLVSFMNKVTDGTEALLDFFAAPDEAKEGAIAFERRQDKLAKLTMPELTARLDDARSALDEYNASTVDLTPKIEDTSDAAVGTILGFVQQKNAFDDGILTIGEVTAANEDMVSTLQDISFQIPFVSDAINAGEEAMKVMGDESVIVDQKLLDLMAVINELIEAQRRLNKQNANAPSFLEKHQDSIAQFSEKAGVYVSAINGIGDAYINLMQTRLNSDKQQELSVAGNIKWEKKRQKEVEKVNAKYEAKQAQLNKKSKKIKRVQTVLNTSVAIMEALSAKTPGYPGNIAIATMIGIMGAMQLATIDAQKYAKGGYVGGRRHSQGGTLIEAEQGEYVISRKGVEAAGIENLNRINAGGGSGSVNISFAGNVMSKDFIEDEAIPQIKEAIRRGADIGIG
nr:hypothetical protein [uncultured Mediterranean phage uvMED]